MATSTANQATTPRRATERSAFKLYAAGFMGGISLALGDLVTNEQAATVIKFQGALRALDWPGIQNGGSVGLILIGVLGALFCWIWPVTSRGDAFMRGFSVFAILSVGTPFKVSKDQLPVQRPADQSTPKAQKVQSGFTWISEANAQDAAPPGEKPNRPANDAVSATVAIVHTGVSSCKPRYWGLFGLGSFLNNSLEICETGHTLPVGTKVKILECWDTGLRSYRYARIEYEWKGSQQIGWAMTGQAPTVWSYVVPEASALTHLPASCKTS